MKNGFLKQALNLANAIIMKNAIEKLNIGKENEKTKIKIV